MNKANHLVTIESVKTKEIATLEKIVNELMIEARDSYQFIPL